MKTTRPFGVAAVVMVVLSAGASLAPGAVAGGAALPVRTVPSLPEARALPPGTITTVAGGVNEGPSPALTTSMAPTAMARWGSTLYVGDRRWRVVRAIDLATGLQHVVAGNGEYGMAGDGGPATMASLTGAIGAMVFDAAGVLYIADAPGSFGGSTTPPTSIRRVGTDGIITSVPGVPRGNTITGLVVAPDGALIFSDPVGSVRRLQNGVVTYIAGNAADSPSGDPPDGQPATNGVPDGALGLSLAANGDLFLTTRTRLRRIDSAGIIHTVATISGSLSSEANGDLLVTSAGIVSTVTTSGVVTPVAGCACPQTVPDGQPALSGAVHAELALELQAGDLVLATNSGTGNTATAIRRVRSDGTIQTVAGTSNGNGGDGGNAAFAQFDANDVAALPNGAIAYVTEGSLWFLEENGEVHEVASADQLVPAGAGSQALPATGLAVSPSGAISVAVAGFIRRWDPSGAITTVAGIGEDTRSDGDGGPATAAALGWVTGIALQPDGGLLIADRTRHVIRRVGTDGTITLFAGRPVDGMVSPLSSTGDQGPATAATFTGPAGLAVDRAGTVYVLDAGGMFGGAPSTAGIRKIDPSGTITTAIPGHLDSSIAAIAVDQADNLLFATGPPPMIDSAAPCVCQILRRRPHGAVEVLAGTSVRADPQSSGDGGPALDARLRATAITIDAGNNIFFIDDLRTMRIVAGVGAPAVLPATPATPVIATAPFTG